MVLGGCYKLSCSSAATAAIGQSHHLTPLSPPCLIVDSPVQRPKVPPGGEEGVKGWGEAALCVCYEGGEHAGGSCHRDGDALLVCLFKPYMVFYLPHSARVAAATTTTAITILFHCATSL